MSAAASDPHGTLNDMTPPVPAGDRPARLLIDVVRIISAMAMIGGGAAAASGDAVIGLALVVPAAAATIITMTGGSPAIRNAEQFLVHVTTMMLTIGVTTSFGIAIGGHPQAAFIGLGAVVVAVIGSNLALPALATRKD